MKSYKNKLIPILSLSALALVAIIALPQSASAIGFGNALEVRDNIKDKNIKVENKNINSTLVRGLDYYPEQTGADDKPLSISTTIHSTTTSDSDLDYKNDGNLPKGIRTAPGIEKRVEEGKWLPQGILKFFDRDNDNDDDDGQVEIKISDFKVSASTTSANIYFKTNVETKGTLTYSASSSLSNATVVNLALDGEHSVNLASLEDDTVYYFQVKLETADGKSTYESRVRALSTSEVDVDLPKINFFHTFSVNENSASVIWITSEKTSSKVWVSATSSVDTTVAPTMQNASGSYFHVFELVDLEADTDYYVKVSSTDSADNTTFSEVLSFTTDTE